MYVRFLYICMYVHVCMCVSCSFFCTCLLAAFFAALGFILHGSAAFAFAIASVSLSLSIYLSLCPATLALRFSSPLQSLLTFSAFAFVRCFL